MPEGTVAAHLCTLYDVCVTGGRAMVWPTTSTYTGRSVPPLCNSLWAHYYRSARASGPGSEDALHSTVFERQAARSQSVTRAHRARNKQAPRLCRPSGRGAIWPNGCSGEKWDAHQKRDQRGVWKSSATMEIVEEREGKTQSDLYSLQ